MTFTFLHADAWRLLPIALLIAIVWRLRRKRAFIALSSVRWVSLLRRRPSSIRYLPAILAIAALVLIVLAVMDPAIPYSESQIQSKGLDIVLVMDLSSSMQETMNGTAPPRSLQQLTFSNSDRSSKPRAGKTRLETVREALLDFISRRRDDRIGLVVFSANAYVVSPLTFDYNYLREYTAAVDEQSLWGEGMTAIGDGIALASYLLYRQSTGEQRNKVIVVFTDGENNFGRDPMQSLTEANAAGIRVHMIGVDLEDAIKENPPVRLLMTAIRKFGGQYYSADTVGQLRAAYAEIDSIEKSLLTGKLHVRNAPVFQMFAVPALVLMLVALSLRVIPFFSDFT